MGPRVTICSAFHIHYPTDSSLLGDGLRVLTRGLVRIAAECRRGAVDVVDHGRAVKHRLLEISRAAKSLTAAGRQRLQASYAKLVALTRGVVRQVTDVVARVASRRLRVVGDGVQVGLLRHYLPMVEQVITQTQARVWGGDRHVPEKILSLFEPHTAVIRKGKAHQPNEFGRLVRLDEVEHGIVSGYAVLDGNPGRSQFVPAGSGSPHRVVWAGAGSRHRRPWLFLRRERARRRSAWRGEGGAAGPRALVEDARGAAETTLVPPRDALACRL